MEMPQLHVRLNFQDIQFEWIFKMFSFIHLFRTKGVLRDEFSYNFWYISFVSKIFHWSLAYWSTKIIFYKRNKNTFFTTRSYSGWILIHIIEFKILLLKCSYFIIYVLTNRFDCFEVSLKTSWIKLFSKYQLFFGLENV